MRITENCAACLFRHQKNAHDDPVYLSRVKELIDNRDPEDSSAYLSDLFRSVREELYGPDPDLTAEKRRYNNLVLGMEEALWERICGSEDPLKTAILFSRAGNYIDFGTVKVEEKTFLGLFDRVHMSSLDEKTYTSFTKKCETARKMVLGADNCGEIVLDKLLIRALKQRYPGLGVTVIVRGEKVMNDVTLSDAEEVGLYGVADVVSSGSRIGGIVYEKISAEARKALDEADIVLLKGLGNFETYTGHGRPSYCLFLCKCELFTDRFEVPLMTGMFTEES